MSRGHLRLGGSSGRLKQDLQGIPARRQRHIDIDGDRIGVDGGMGIVCGHVAMPALLIQATEVRVNLLEAGQRIESLGNLAKIALAHRHEVQRVAIFRQRGEQLMARRQRLGELSSLDQFLDAHDLGLDRRGGGGSRGGRMLSRSRHVKDPRASFKGPSQGS